MCTPLSPAFRISDSNINGVKYCAVLQLLPLSVQIFICLPHPTPTNTNTVFWIMETIETVWVSRNIWTVLEISKDLFFALLFFPSLFIESATRPIHSTICDVHFSVCCWLDMCVSSVYIFLNSYYFHLKRSWDKSINFKKISKSDAREAVSEFLFTQI